MLNSLTTKKMIRTFSVSPENPTGEKGMGAGAQKGVLPLPQESWGRVGRSTPTLY